MIRIVTLAAQSAVIFLCVSQLVLAASIDLGKGFRDHGVGVPISNHRGMVATVDGDGRNVVLTWLMDHRGAYELLKIDAQTGKATEHPIPFKNAGDSPFSSILSSGNKFYTHYGNYFVEFDPAKSAFTFHSKTTPQMAMSMTEDDNGVIWSATYPQSGIVSFNPKTRKFKDYGHVYKQNWAQYPRHIAADDTGWIYFALGNTASQIISLDPATGKATPVLAENERKTGIAYVYRDTDGKVYGQPLPGAKEQWYELYKGQAKKLESHANVKPKPTITGSQTLVHTAFPDGSTLVSCNLMERKLTVRPKGSKERKELSFDYKSEGAGMMGCAATDQGTISGGTMFPMQNFIFDPREDKMTNRPAYGQWNAIAPAGDHFFVGAYGGGVLLDWVPGKPWIQTEKAKADCNPLYLTECTPAIHRPAKVLPLMDGKTVVLAGTPQYGYTGGGLLFWGREDKSRVLLTHEQIIPQHSTESLVELPGGKLLAGTTTSAGTGGEVKAKEAEMYIMDIASKQLDWHAVIFPGVREYTDLYAAADGLIYGFADSKIFFVFNPEKREVVYQKDISKEFERTVHEQGPRIFVTGPKGEVFVLFRTGIGQVDPKTYAIKRLARSPVTMDGGGGYLDGRIYFISGSHLYSWQMNGR